MKITPITDYKEFYRTKDLPGCDKDILLAEVTDKGNPEILSFLPDADPERMVVQSSELMVRIVVTVCATSRTLPSTVSRS